MLRSTYLLAKWEAARTIRSKSVWGIALLTLFLWIPTFQQRPSYLIKALGDTVAFAAFQRPFAIFIPLGAVTLGCQAISKEFTTGSAKILFSLPITPRTIVGAKVLGRGITLTLAFSSALLLGLVIGGPRVGSISLFKLTLFMLATELYILANLAVAVGISASVRRPRRSLVLGFSYLLVALIIWPTSLSRWLTTDLVPLLGVEPTWSSYIFIRRLSPLTAYRSVTNAIIGAPNSGGDFFAAVQEVQPNFDTNIPVALEPVPWFLDPWVSAVTTFGFVIIFTVLGMWRLERVDPA